MAGGLSLRHGISERARSSAAGRGIVALICDEWWPPLVAAALDEGLSEWEAECLVRKVAAAAARAYRAGVRARRAPRTRAGR